MPTKRLCSVDGCDKPVFCRNQCSKHYDRWRRSRPAETCSIETCRKPAKAGNNLCYAHARKKWRYGDPLAGRENGAPTEFYLDALKFEGDDCLLWPFSKSADGYARYRPRTDTRTQMLSRRICEDVYGDPPTPKHEAAHSCGKGSDGCINPNHLRWATPTENCADRITHGTANRGEKLWSNKLTAQDVIDVRKLMETMPCTHIARLYGVSNTAIYSIKRRINWDWLKG